MSYSEWVFQFLGEYVIPTMLLVVCLGTLVLVGAMLWEWLYD